MENLKTVIGMVILNYNDSMTTINLLNLIKDYKSIDHIVVVDNLSTDNSYINLKKLQTSKIDVIQTDKNGGYSYGNNYGAFYLIEKYSIDVLFIANPDVKFTEKFILTCTKKINENLVQAISGIMLHQNGKLSNWSGKINKFYEDLIDCTIFIKQFKKTNDITYAKKIDNLIFVDFLPGALFGISSNVFKEIGGFDENVFLFYEEEILSIRLKQKGYKLALCEELSFKHIHSASIDKSITKINKLKQLYISRLYLYKNYRNKSYLQILLLKIFMFYGLLMRKIIYKILY